MHTKKLTHKSEIDWKEIFSIPDIISNSIGILLILFALKEFMMPKHFLDGGILGISLLVHNFKKGITVYTGEGDVLAT